MPTKELFELRVLIAAEQAKQAGFEQTYLALLDVLRTSRYSEERMIGSLARDSSEIVFVDTQIHDDRAQGGFTKR